MLTYYTTDNDFHDIKYLLKDPAFWILLFDMGLAVPNMQRRGDKLWGLRC